MPDIDGADGTTQADAGYGLGDVDRQTGGNAGRIGGIAGIAGADAVAAGGGQGVGIQGGGAGAERDGGAQIAAAVDELHRSARRGAADAGGEGDALAGGNRGGRGRQRHAAGGTDGLDQRRRGAGLVVDVARIDGGDAVAAGGEGAGAEAGLGVGQRDDGAEVGAVIGELNAAAGCAAADAGGEGDALAGITRVAIAGDAGAAGGQGVGPAADQQVAVDRTEAAGLVVGRAAGAGGKAADAGHRIVARGDAVEIGGAATVLQRGQGVEGGIDVALAVAGLLVDQGDDAGEGGRCGGGAGKNVERLRPGAVVARIDEVTVVRGGVQGNVGNIALAVGGNAGRVLPGRLGMVKAGAAAAGPQFRAAIGGALVPDRFRDVGKRRTEIGVVGRRPVQRRVGGIGKLGAADAGAVDRRAEPVDAPAVRCRRRAGAVAAGGAAVAGRDNDGHSLGDGLLPEVAVEVGAGAAEAGLA